MDKHISSVLELYDDLKTITDHDVSTPRSRLCISNIVEASLDILRTLSQKELISRVPEKRYFAFCDNNLITRPVNADLFLFDLEANWLDRYRSDRKVAYTAAIAPCLVFDLHKENDRKRPATYFERLTGQEIATILGTSPSRRKNLNRGGASIKMTADFLFDMTDGPNIHVPVKLSTRERASQAWTHQHLLDQHYGRGRYRGVMILLGETKLDRDNLVVTEICVPGQWRGYQLYQATMHRIYYLDMPERYRELNHDFPNLVQDFSELSRDQLLG